MVAWRRAADGAIGGSRRRQRRRLRAQEGGRGAAPREDRGSCRWRRMREMTSSGAIDGADGAAEEDGPPAAERQHEAAEAAAAGADADAATEQVVPERNGEGDEDDRVSSKRRKVVVMKREALHSLRERHEALATELFFLENHASLLDCLAWPQQERSPAKRTCARMPIGLFRRRRIRCADGMPAAAAAAATTTTAAAVDVAVATAATPTLARRMSSTALIVSGASPGAWPAPSVAARGRARVRLGGRDDRDRG